MSHPVNIEIFFLAKTAVDEKEVDRWLKHMDVSEFDWPSIPDPAFLVALAAKRCYKSFEPGLNKNVTRVRKNYAEYLDNVLASGHGSVLEHSTYTFAVEGISRVFTGEMNRHRAGWAISEGSMRYIRMDDIGYWEPLSIRFDESDDPVLMRKKTLTRQVFHRAFSEMEANYAELENIWASELSGEFSDKKKITSLMRRIIGMGVATGGVWTGNLRALRWVLTQRCSPAAEEEICHVFTRICKEIGTLEPELFGDFELGDDGFYYPRYYKV